MPEINTEGLENPLISVQAAEIVKKYAHTIFLSGKNSKKPTKD
jgi:hypothetical protein